MLIRAVSGWGPRCGCGGASALHVTPDRQRLGRFLCASCVTAALDAGVPCDQPNYWPGDEDRDEPYVDPRERAA